MTALFKHEDEFDHRQALILILDWINDKRPSAIVKTTIGRAMCVITVSGITYKQSLTLRSLTN